MRSFRINKNFFSVLSISLLYPFLGLIVSFFYFNRKWFTKIIFFCCIFYGFVYVVPNDNVDSYFYKKDFLLYNSFNFSEFISYIFTIESQKSDIVEPLISFFVSRFTSEARYLFLVYSIFFGYFLYLNLNILYKYTTVNKNMFSFFSIIGFILFNGIWNINGIRFWLACHIFVFAILTIFIEKKKYNAIWTLILLPFLHFSFIFPILILILFLICNKFISYRFLTIICLLFSVINFVNVDGLLSSRLEGVLPEFLFIKVATYTDAEYAQKLVTEQEDLSILSIIHNSIIKIYLVLFLVFNYRKAFKERNFNFYKFFLFFSSFALMLQVIPSMGRFLNIGYLLSIAYLVLNNYNKTYIKILSILIFFYLIGLLRIYGFFFNNNFFLSNFLIEAIK